MSDQLLYEAQRHFRAGRAQEAWRLYAEILRTNPQHFEAHYALGLISFHNRQYDRAEQLFGNAFRLNQTSVDSVRMRGLALLHMRRNQEALDCFDHAVSLDPGSVDALSDRALAQLELHNFEEALAAFDSVFLIDPNHAVSWSNRGNVLVAMRRFAEAVASYDRALSIRPDFPEARNNRKYALGMSYFDDGKFDQAQYILDEAVRLNPLLVEGLCFRGIALLRLKRHQEAIACFDHAVAAKPDFVEAISNRATAWLELNRIDEALAGFEAALAVDPNHAVSWNNRGNALMAIQRYDEALASYDKALVLQPVFPEAADNRVNALFSLGRMSRCPPVYIRALFDDYASYYDAAMVEALGYRGHVHLRTLAERVLPTLSPPWRILDLGSGTGLVGEVFKDLAQGGRLDGIDLSPRMIEAARARSIYDELILGDLEDFLSNSGRNYDLILAADTMVYFGDLAPTLSGIAKQLEPGGFCLFAVEAKAGEGWEQMPVRRFRHSASYLCAASAGAGLKFVDTIDCIIRREKNDPVAGFAVALQKIVH